MKVLITGASRGIGLFLFERFLNEGYQVCGTYGATLPKEEYKQYFSKVDVADTDQVQKWVSECAAGSNELVLINCASINYNAIARKADVEKWKQLIDVNLIGTFRVINAMLPFMYENGYGRIINLSSVLAQKGIPGTSAYAASKAALWGMTKSIAAENAKNNITINNLNLGYFNAGMTLTDVPEKVLEEVKQAIPTQQLGEPENVYNAVKFLINSEYVTGTSIDINGGLF